MTITDLNNDYYLALNDIWVKADLFAQQTTRLELTVKNLTTGSLLNFKLYPSPDNEYHFNISEPIRALFVYEHIAKGQTLHQFEITFTPTYSDGSSETTTVTKYFIWGGKEKKGTAEWFLNSSAPLIVGKWIEWGDVQLPGFARRIQGNSIVDFVPTQTYKMPLRGCDYKIVRFLNSLGGWQYFIFETYEVKNKTKPKKTTARPITALRQDNFRNLGLEYEQSLTLQTRTPYEIQDVIVDLVLATEVYLYNPEGNDEESKWQRLMLESNDPVENNYDKAYENKFEYTLSNYLKREL